MRCVRWATICSAPSTVCFETHGGKPVAENRAALSSALRQADFTPNAEQLRSWFEAISDGTHITVDVKRARF